MRNHVNHSSASNSLQLGKEKPDLQTVVDHLLRVQSDAYRIFLGLNVTSPFEAFMHEIPYQGQIDFLRQFGDFLQNVIRIRLLSKAVIQRGKDISAIARQLELTMNGVYHQLESLGLTIQNLRRLGDDENKLFWKSNLAPFARQVLRAAAKA